MRHGKQGLSARRVVRSPLTATLLTAVPLAAMLVVAVPVSATTVFTDGFESGNFVNWSVSKAGSGTATVQSSTVRSGSFAAKLTSVQASGSDAYARHALGTPLQVATITADVDVTAEGPVNFNVPLLRGWASDGSLIFSLYRQNQAGNQVWIQYGGAYHSTTGLLPLNTWAHVAVAVATNGGSTSSVAVWLNGVLVHSKSGVALPANWFKTAQIGNERSGEAFGIVVDNVQVTNTYGSTSTPPPALPAFSHVFWIVMENEEYGSIVGNSAAPYINSLISKYGLATTFYAESHPSEPNYLAMFSGSTQGVTDDNIHNLSGTNLVDQLAAHGKSWRVFAQNVPLGCYTGASASGGEDGSGTYVRRHEPAISFTNISSNSTRCANITDFTHFNAGAASFELIVPNLCNDMHDCSVSTGDSFLKGFVPKITSSSAFANSVIFLTWDEGTTSTNGGGHVATVVISPLAKVGFRSSTWHNHYSMLRTVENAWGLGCLNNTCSANDMREFFG